MQQDAGGRPVQSEGADSFVLTVPVTSACSASSSGL